MTSFRAVLLVTFSLSLGTGVFWHGLPFIAEQDYGFSASRNLVFFIYLGAVYTAGAFGAGKALRWIGGRNGRRGLSLRGSLVACVVGLTLVCVLPLCIDTEWAIWLSAGVGTVLYSFIWPVVESYVTAGRHGSAMRDALAKFNLTWMPATLVPMFAMSPIIEHHGRWAIAVIALTNVPALFALRWFAAKPEPHFGEEQHRHVSREYPLLLRSARVLLPLSYVLSAALGPLLPYLLNEIGLAKHWQTPSAATWMVTRVLTSLVMWRMAFWHGRWGTLVLGGVSIVAGFACVVIAGSLMLVLAGLAVLGMGMGLVYYAALYYAMAVGGAAVDSGGTHEGLIGAGYTVGPLACLMGLQMGGEAHGPLWIVGLLCGIVALCAIPAILPYVRARQQRTKQGVSVKG